MIGIRRGRVYAHLVFLRAPTRSYHGVKTHAFKHTANLRNDFAPTFFKVVGLRVAPQWHIVIFCTEDGVALPAPLVSGDCTQKFVVDSLDVFLSFSVRGDSAKTPVVGVQCVGTCIVCRMCQIPISKLVVLLFEVSNPAVNVLFDVGRINTQSLRSFGHKLHVADCARVGVCGRVTHAFSHCGGYNVLNRNAVFLGGTNHHVKVLVTYAASRNIFCPRAKCFFVHRVAIRLPRNIFAPSNSVDCFLTEVTVNRALLVVRITVGCFFGTDEVGKVGRSFVSGVCRTSGAITITSTECSEDCRHARAYASGFIFRRRMLTKQLSVRLPAVFLAENHLFQIRQVPSCGFKRDAQQIG